MDRTALLLCCVLALSAAALLCKAELEAPIEPRCRMDACPSMPEDLSGLMQPPPKKGPVFINRPWDLKRYAARRGKKSVQLPPGATDVRIKLKRHEDWVFGTAFNPEWGKTRPADLEWYKDMTKQLFDSITPQYRFKWYRFEPNKGNYSFAYDIMETQYIAFARQAGFSMIRGHALQWRAGQPDWVSQLEKAGDCKKWADAFMQRVAREVSLFKGQIQHYDVFNEVLIHPGMLEKCKLWDTVFPDAFKLAHQIDPAAKLCLNEERVIEGRSGPKLVRLIKEHLIANKAPIHCIGLQAHYEHYGLNLTHQQTQLDILASVGLPIVVSEFTLFSTWFGPGNGPISYLDEGTQANATVELLRLWFSHPIIHGIFMWGWWDGNMWTPNAGIYTTDRKPKQAAIALRKLWNEELTSNIHLKGVSVASPGVSALPERDGEVTVTAGAGGHWVDFEGFHGEYEYSFKAPDGKRQQGTVNMGKSNARHSLVPRRG